MIELLSEAALSPSAAQLSEEINKAWENLADSVFSPDYVIQLLSDIVQNPLCIAITAALLVVAGFKFFASICSVFNIRH